MATYTIQAGHKAVGPWALTATQVDTVTFTDNVGKAQVVNTDGTVDVWVTTDGSTPSVPSAGASTVAYRVPGGQVLEVTMNGAADTVKLVSSGTPTVSVQASD